MRLLFAFAAIFSLWVNYARSAELSAVETEASIELKQDGESFLTYHKAEVPPPAEADPIYKRSGFIHPVKTPGGAAVTGIHPADHFHHIGLWHAWVKCKHGEDEIDFWNLKSGTGRVAFRKTVAIHDDTDAVGFVVEQDHIACKGDDKQAVVVLHEIFTVTARLVDGAFEIDYETVQKNISENALELPAYRYGGPIAYRAPNHWRNGNSDYLSSEGKTREDGHTTRSKWISMWGPAKADKKGNPVSLAILGHPTNHDAPQRMRVWPPKTNDGAIFFNYVPIQETGWSIQPGESSTMRYRLVVADAKPDVKGLNARWDKWAKE